MDETVVGLVGAVLGAAAALLATAFQIRAGRRQEQETWRRQRVVDLYEDLLAWAYHLRASTVWLDDPEVAPDPAPSATPTSVRIVRARFDASDAVWQVTGFLIEAEEELIGLQHQYQRRRADGDEPGEFSVPQELRLRIRSLTSMLQRSVMAEVEGLRPKPRVRRWWHRRRPRWESEVDEARQQVLAIMAKRGQMRDLDVLRQVAAPPQPLLNDSEP
ncbi:hypothetical protein [Micromonospora sp. L31]|uniref:hypothetical protein n=1 Tax=Micromonospora sp. L31 TaxID=3452213 RepID=UPI003F8A6FFE